MACDGVSLVPRRRGITVDGAFRKNFCRLDPGIATGLFFGELVAGLKVIGDIFVKLLQITVLPYIIVSLIAGFGRMEMGQARRLAVRGSIVLVVIWVLAMAMIFIAALAFPDIEAASFFSSSVSALLNSPTCLISTCPPIFSTP